MIAHLLGRIACLCYCKALRSLVSWFVDLSHPEPKNILILLLLCRGFSNRVGTVGTALATAVATVVNYIATARFCIKRSGSALHSKILRLL